MFVRYCHNLSLFVDENDVEAVCHEAVANGIINLFGFEKGNLLVLGLVNTISRSLLRLNLTFIQGLEFTIKLFAFFNLLLFLNLVQYELRRRLEFLFEGVLWSVEAFHNVLKGRKLFDLFGLSFLRLWQVQLDLRPGTIKEFLILLYFQGVVQGRGKGPKRNSFIINLWRNCIKFRNGNLLYKIYR